MQFLRILPILILLPVLAFADSDKMFKVSTDQFKEGDLFEPVPEMAISISGTVTTTVPTLPLKDNVLFLRHKKSPKEYHWVHGKVSLTNYRKLHAFSLAKNHLTLFDVLQLRMYPTKNSKAFQDETDIYFDKDYIYSPRVPKLFFMKNGRWQILNEDPLPGIIKVDSPDKDLKASSLDPKVRSNSKMYYPVEPGPYAFVFSSPNYLPLTDIDVVQSGKALVFKPALIHLEESRSTEGILTVTVDQIAGAPNLESTEVLYDKFLEELRNSVNVVDTNEFAMAYPAKKQAISVGLEDTNKVYALYAKRYDLVRAEAKDLWRKSKMGGVAVLDEAFKQKFDSLHAIPWRVYLTPDSVFYEIPSRDTAGVTSVSSAAEPTSSAATLASSSDAAPASSSGEAPVATTPVAPQLVTAAPSFLILKFSQPANRYAVTWKGNVPGYSPDSLANLLVTPGSGVRIIVSLQNNKPVWIYGTDGTITRHHYRYVNLEVEIAGTVVAAQGAFTLPQYIFEQQEVQDWLNPPPPPPPPAESSSSSMPEISSSSSSFVEVPSSSSQEELPKNIVNDPRRGRLAIIDSGSFRYYGHVVAMSPFAIQTTEMTQELMEKIMLHVDSAERVPNKSKFIHPQKPVHNINWYNARKACQVNGGDLPTEAQWEFAGRAGSIEGAPWILDSIPDPSVYAIYAENSYKKRKEDEAYGPQQVATKKPNAWGIYDMSGNVAEWTRDNYFMLSFWIESSNPTGALFGYSRVYKGGSWKDKEKLLNMTVRDDEDPRYWSETLGFRCVYPLDVIGK